MKKFFVFKFGIIVVITIVSAISFSNCNRRSQETIRIGYLPIAAELPLFVAVEKEYFREEGLDIKLFRFTSSNDLGNAATADNVDIMAGTASNVIFDIGYVSGKKHLAIAVNPYSNTKNHITDYLLVNKNSNINSIKDLKGKKIASFPGSVNKIFTFLIFEKYGISRDSIDYFELLPKDWEIALKTNRVDAISALEPVATQIMKDEVGRSIFPGFYADLMPDVPLSAHWISYDYYNRTKRDKIEKILRVYNKAIDFCRDSTNIARTYLSKYANVRKDIINDVNLNPWQKRDEINADQFQKYINLLYDNKALQNNENINDYLIPY